MPEQLSGITSIVDNEEDDDLTFDNFLQQCIRFGITEDRIRNEDNVRCKSITNPQLEAQEKDNYELPVKAFSQNFIPPSQIPGKSTFRDGVQSFKFTKPKQRTGKAPKPKTGASKVPDSLAGRNLVKPTLTKEERVSLFNFKTLEEDMMKQLGELFCIRTKDKQELKKQLEVIYDWYFKDQIKGTVLDGYLPSLVTVFENNIQQDNNLLALE